MRIQLGRNLTPIWSAQYLKVKHDRSCTNFNEYLKKKVHFFQFRSKATCQNFPMWCGHYWIKTCINNVQFVFLLVKNGVQFYLFKHTVVTKVKFYIHSIVREISGVNFLFNMNQSFRDSVRYSTTAVTGANKHVLTWDCNGTSLLFIAYA